MTNDLNIIDFHKRHLPGGAGGKRICEGSRTSRQPLGRAAELCVRTPHGAWSVVVARDWRFAYLSAVPCTDRPATSDAVRLKEE